MNANVSTATRPGLAWLAGGLAVGLLAATLAGPTLGARAQSSESTIIYKDQVATIQVSGTGRVFLAPDIADVTLGVIVQDEEAQPASAEAATTMDAIVKALIALGIDEKDIQTTQLSLNPVYDWENSPPNIEGWEASNLVRVTVRDVDQIGAVVDTAVGAGATSVNGVSFRVEDPTEAEATARSAAVADARAKADLLASEAGVNITGVLTISETSSPMPGPIYMERSFAGSDAMGEAATPVLPGEVELQIVVYVTYTIE